MELALKLAVENLRAAIDQTRMEASRLNSLMANGATDDIRIWATGDRERLEKRIQNQLKELAQLESD